MMRIMLVALVLILVPLSTVYALLPSESEALHVGACAPLKTWTTVQMSVGYDQVDAPFVQAAETSLTTYLVEKLRGYGLYERASLQSLSLTIMISVSKELDGITGAVYLRLTHWKPVHDPFLDKSVPYSGWYVSRLSPLVLDHITDWRAERFYNFVLPELVDVLFDDFLKKYLSSNC